MYYKYLTNTDKIVEDRGMSVTSHPVEAPPRVSFDTHPDRYRHWRLEIEGAVARLVLDVDEAAGLVPRYPRKLHPYDTSVNTEQHSEPARRAQQSARVRVVRD